MQLATRKNSIPWEFDAGEADSIRTVLQSPLVRAYFKSLKHMALENKLVNPQSPEMDVKASNDYMAGQDYILDALLADNVFIPTIPTKQGV